MKKKFSMFLVIAFIAITCFGIINAQKVEAAENNVSTTIGKKKEVIPIHRYGFDTDNGNTVIDTGSMAETEGKFNGIANGTQVITENGSTFRKFNGTSDIISFRDPVFNNKEKFSFKFKIKTTGSNVLLFGHAIDLSRFNGISLYNINGNLYFTCYNGSVDPNSINRTDVVSNKQINDNVWHDVLVTWDGTTNVNGIKIYIDDLVSPDSTGKMKTMPTVAPNNFQIGRTNNSYFYSYFKGELDEIEIYDEVVEYEIKEESISLDKTSLNLLEGATEKLIATVLPVDATNKKVLWTSSNESIATVDENGNVTAIKEGQATITAKVENTNLTDTCEVTVTKPIEVNKNGAILSISLVNGATKEYDVSMEEVEKFINWFEERSNGNGPSLYSFTKKISPYESVKEYIVHDKIVSFEVREYKVTE